MLYTISDVFYEDNTRINDEKRIEYNIELYLRDDFDIPVKDPQYGYLLVDPNKITDDINKYINFVCSVGLNYNDNLRMEVALKIKEYHLLTYTQLYQLKIYYDTKFKKFVKDSLPKKYHYILCKGFYEYAREANTPAQVVRYAEDFINMKEYENKEAFYYNPEDEERIKKIIMCKQEIWNIKTSKINAFKSE